jgi:hypothetical protein
MPEDQGEPFFVALNRLRDRLREGAPSPGARITAMDVADELRLSTTPVREALSRLAGEGLVEDRRGQGYFVRSLSAADIADLYRMSLALLLIALEPRRLSQAPRTEAVDEPAVGAVARTEEAFRDWVARSGSRVLVREFRTLQVQLGPVRRVEGRILPDLEAEADRLLSSERQALRGEWLADLRQFHGRRIREAPRLAAALDGSDQPPRK